MEGFDFNQLHIRPRFRFEINHAPAAVEAELVSHLKKQKPRFPYNVNHSYFNIDVPTHLSHFWSPRISFEIEKIEGKENACLIRGLIGPKPHVWTFFVFIYFGLVIIGLFASLYGLSKYSLESYSHLIWGFPIALLLMSTAYLASKSGEKIGAEQIHLLKSLLENSFSNLNPKLKK